MKLFTGSSDQVMKLRAAGVSANGCSDSLVPHSTAHLPTSVDVVCRKLNTWRCFAVSGFQSVSFRLSHNRSMSFQFSQKLLGSGLS